MNITNLFLMILFGTIHAFSSLYVIEHYESFFRSLNFLDNESVLIVSDSLAVTITIILTYISKIILNKFFNITDFEGKLYIEIFGIFLGAFIIIGLYKMRNKYKKNKKIKIIE